MSQTMLEIKRILIRLKPQNGIISVSNDSDITTRIFWLNES